MTQRNSDDHRIPAILIAGSDALIVISATLITQLAWPVSGDVVLRGLNLSQEIRPTYTSVSIGIICVWLLGLWISGSRDQRVLGSGSKEYSLVARASILAMVLVALFSYLFKAEIARGYVLIALPVGTVLLLTSRWLWRRFFNRKRKQGKYQEKVVIVGSEGSVRELATRLTLHPELGLQTFGAFLSDFEKSSKRLQTIDLANTSVPVLGGLDDLLAKVRALGVRNIILGNTEDLPASEVRKLGWELLPGDERLFLAANILDVAGPRLEIKPLAGIPLIEVTEPEFNGVSRAIKRVIDLCVATLALVMSSPLFIVAAIRIKRFDGGPIFFAQKRVGRHGKIFTMLKFRTMSVGAEAALESLDFDRLDSDSNEVLFKLRNDPRVTKPGKWLRRTSVDELPQLINVLIGNMSLVGPRPPLPREAADYESHVKIKFLVKPGMTGQWQITGRSDLSWDDSVRADLTYVQNWSVIADLVILWRTIKVVLSGKGAY